MPHFALTKHKEMIEEHESEYRGVPYRIEVSERRDTDNRDSRIVEVKSNSVSRTVYKESLEPRTIGKWIPFLRSKPRSKEEHIEKVMSSFKSKVDEYREFQEEVEERNDS